MTVEARTEIDFEAEGFLGDLDGRHREGRLKLLRELSENGVSIEELREAIAGGRLALLPVERVFLGRDDRKFSLSEIADRAGIDLGFLQRHQSAMGMPYSDPDERNRSQESLDGAIRLKRFIDAGFSEEGMLHGGRAIGMATARIAQANIELGLRSLSQPGDTEYDIAIRLANAAEEMIPMTEATMSFALRSHLLEQVRRDVLGVGDLDAGSLGGVASMSVCFADLVGFTKLGEEVPLEALSSVASRLESMATTVSQPPVRLIKAMGDAVMMVSKDTNSLLCAALGLIGAAEDAGAEFPLLRVGIAHGGVLGQGGDYYGRPVNLASRITKLARPSSVLVDGETKTRIEAKELPFRFSYAGERSIRGIEGGVKLYRVRHT